MINHGKQPYVVLDRDGTIIQEKHYLSQPEDVELIPGVASGLRELVEMGLGLVVITNQSGVGRGYFDETCLLPIHQQMRDLLRAEGVQLGRIYYCPHPPKDDCFCRKPKPGLLKLAAGELNFEPQHCFVIGDKASDIEFGQGVGATTFLVSTGYGAQVARDGTATPDYKVAGISDAARVIRASLPSRRQEEP